MIINIQEIMDIIPHRYPFLLVDKILELEINKSIIGIKNITFNEPHFLGHFPRKPIMPGVLIIEAMAQLSAILIAKSFCTKNNNKNILFLAIENTKFRRIVEPGDVMHMHSIIEQNRGFVWKFFSVSKVNNKVVAESKFIAMLKNNDK